MLEDYSLVPAGRKLEEAWFMMVASIVSLQRIRNYQKFRNKNKFTFLLGTNILISVSGNEFQIQ